MGELVSLHEVSRFRDYSMRVLFMLQKHVRGTLAHELRVELYYRFKAQSHPSDVEETQPPLPSA